MGDKVVYSIFDTAFGLCGIAGSERGIVKFILPGMTEEEIKENIKDKYNGADADDRRFIKIKDLIKRYFNGERIDFDFPLDLICCTEFQQRVYTITRTIPYGEVKTYRWIAERLGLPNACRAVGGALSKNPIPLLIPCHRVIREDGGMGGFTAPGGVDLKIKMLKIEAENKWNTPYIRLMCGGNLDFL